jgi:hypothetical protein
MIGRAGVEGKGRMETVQESGAESAHKEECVWLKQKV